MNELNPSLKDRWIMFTVKSERFLVAIFVFILLLCMQVTQAQGPPGYTLCADEGEMFTLPERSHVAYGAQGMFSYLYNQTGTITFNNATFGDPAPGIHKSGYYQIADATESIGRLSWAMKAIKDHLSGTSPLSNAQINAIADTIQENIFVVGDTVSLVLQAFDLVDYYESNNGPLFLNAASKGGFPNTFGASDGYELVRAVFRVQQGIQDYVYTSGNVKKYLSILEGRKFQTADFFPGVCPEPDDPATSYTVQINASMPTEYGKRTAWSSTPARRPTGYYLAPGSVGSVKVPAAMINQGFMILVGAHTYDHKGRNNVKRFFRVTNSFPITDTLTQIVNPFGGGIYILTPYEADLWIVEVQLTNVVPAPFFSFKTFNKTTLQEWKDVQRKNPAPWADFESDKYMMQVPTSWIYNYDDPVTLMQDWDNRMDVVSTLLGYPLLRNNTILYLQVDLDIMYGFYGIGNPQINNTYNPMEAANGNKNHWFLRPGVTFWETEFHEMGHAQLFSKFPGETEAAVNVPAAAIYNRLYGMNIDTALGRSFGNNPQITRDQAALNWMVTPNFRAGNPMDISNTTKDEVRYQQRGYAKYIEMAALFGWELIDSFYKQEQLDFINQVPGDGLDEADSRIFRFSKIAGADLRPLIHFWGLHPKDSTALRLAINGEDLKPSKLICDRLTHYQSIIPRNNAEFEVHAKAFFGGSVPAGGDPDYGSGWYNVWLPLYNETHGTMAVEAMQNIIDLYFPEGCPTVAPIPVVTVNSATICSGDSVTLLASGAATYKWSNGATGSSITVSPTETTTYSVNGKMAGYVSDTVYAQVIVNPLPIVEVNNVTICSGQSAILAASGAETYAWSNGSTAESIEVNPQENTVYTVTGTSLGCSTTVESIVTVNDLPVVNLGADITLQDGEDVTLDATGPDLTYIWSTGAITPTIVINSAGSYTVTVTNNAGCTAIDSVLVTIITSSDDPAESYTIIASPNPTNDFVDIICTGNSISSVQLMAIPGIVLLSETGIVDNGTAHRICLTDFPPGLYYIRITGKDFTKTVPVVKY
ncbi:MAG: hypothetical protein IPP15_01085 [Saprospiraceae bacterium]|uniref:Peptidase M60 domain-containing protein n=1 Tax=Candidatus Opimibacter skivensis TaxID=2982028 RepID=A0A9D7SRX7_9BACT|nr:hypothetical protein [Candidatus Opimibacter skivensis]